MSLLPIKSMHFESSTRLGISLMIRTCSILKAILRSVSSPMPKTRVITPITPTICQKWWTKSKKTPKSTQSSPTSNPSNKTSSAWPSTTKSPSAKATKPPSPPPTTHQYEKAKANTNAHNWNLAEPKSPMKPPRVNNKARASSDSICILNRTKNPWVTFSKRSDRLLFISNQLLILYSFSWFSIGNYFVYRYAISVCFCSLSD